MASTVDDLDSLALRRLFLLESLLKKKQLLAEYMKNGFFQLGKARYALGGHAVSALRIPDGDIAATAKSVNNLQSLDTCPHPCNIRELFTVTQETSPQNNSKPLANDVDELTSKLSESSILSDGSHTKVGTGSRDSTQATTVQDNIDKVANKKPINWFSALPPQSLRQAQSSFVASLQLAAACVSMQEELDVLDQHYLETKKSYSSLEE